MGNKCVDITKKDKSPTILYLIKTQLCIDVQRIIYDFLGHDEKSIYCKKKLNKMFASGTIGHPYLEYYYQPKYNNIRINFMVPSYHYFENNMIIKQKRVTFDHLYNDFNKVFFRYTIDKNISTHIKNLRNNIFIQKNANVCTIHEGPSDLPVDVYYNELDYKFWYFLGYIRGLTADEIISNTIARFDWLKDMYKRKNYEQYEIEVLEYWTKLLLKN